MEFLFRQIFITIVWFFSVFWVINFSPVVLAAPVNLESGSTLFAAQQKTIGVKGSHGVFILHKTVQQKHLGVSTFKVLYGVLDCRGKSPFHAFSGGDGLILFIVDSHWQSQGWNWIGSERNGNRYYACGRASEIVKGVSDIIVGIGEVPKRIASREIVIPLGMVGADNPHEKVRALQSLKRLPLQVGGQDRRPRRCLSGASGFLGFVQSFPQKDDSQHARTSGYYGKDCHEPLGISIAPRIKVSAAGYRLRDIFILIGLYVGGVWLSYYVLEWLTRPTKKRNDQDCDDD